MIKRKYIRRAYIEKAYCDKCGGLMVSTGIAYMTDPPKFPYKCSNPECDFTQVFWESERPGQVIYEFEEAEIDV